MNFGKTFNIARYLNMSLFIDEAYQISEDKIAGTRILDFMLPHADSLDGEFGKLVWILAGYSNKMEIS